MSKKPITINRLTAGDFPPAVRPFWENVPKDPDIRLALTLNAIVCYCGLAPRLRVKYVYDMELSMLLLNLLCIGPSGRGKKVFNWCTKMLMSKLILKDQEERRMLREYNEEKRRKSANKEAKPEPIISISFLQKFTLPVAVKYCDHTYRKYGDWMPFFLYGDELASFTENRKGNGEFQAVARTAYSLGETYCRDTLYQEGYNACVDLNWNSVLVGQEPALEKYINKEGILLGDAGRQILVKLKDGLGEDATTILPLTAEQQRHIHAATSMLMAETYTEDNQLKPIHVVDMNWLESDVRRWCSQVREEVLKTGSRAMDSFYVRASLSSFRISTLLYHLWDEDPSKQKQVRRCYYHFAQMILDNAMAQWGQLYESLLPKDKEATVKQPTLYDQMPKRFSRDQLREMVIKLELGTPARIFIFKWLKKKWIYEAESGVYEKVY